MINIKLGKINLFLIVFFFFSFFEFNQIYASELSSPEKAFNTFVRAIQMKDVNRAFKLDYNQQKTIYGKFEYEIKEQKEYYARSFEGNPSICLNTFNPIEGLPCDGKKERNMVTDIRLFIAKGAKYEILESILYGQNKSKSRILIKVVYLKSNSPVLIEDLKAVQVYGHLQIPPVTPSILPHSGILDSDNIFFLGKSVKLKYGAIWREFPIKYVKKVFKEALLEVGALKAGKNWMISYTKLLKDKIIFTEIIEVDSSVKSKKDAKAAGQDYAASSQLHDQLNQEYKLCIVSRPNTPSGIWRIPANEPNARNYYIIVEAVTADGKKLKIPITSEEDGKTRTVETWGLRVKPEVFEQVKRDKMDNGTINRNVFAIKKRGYLTPEYVIPTTGGAITEW